jgi:hypothetical protein
MDRHKSSQETVKEPRRLPRLGSSGRSPAGLGHIAYAVTGLLLLCMAACLACSSDKREVRHVALQFVEGIKNGDAETLDGIMDWERWYSVYTAGNRPGPAADESGDKKKHTKEGMRRSKEGSGEDEGMSEDFKEQKDLLLSVLSSDRILALRYLTAEHAIKRISINGLEARVEISQEDRTTGEKRLLTLQLHKDPEAGWRIYKFLSEDLKKT